MATIINTPGTQADNSGVGVVVGIILAIVVIALFAFYAVPALRRPVANPNSGTINVQLQTPAPSTGATPSTNY